MTLYTGTRTYACHSTQIRMNPNNLRVLLFLELQIRNQSIFIGREESDKYNLDIAAGLEPTSPELQRFIYNIPSQHYVIVTCSGQT